jgi:hypothetical protein
MPDRVFELSIPGYGIRKIKVLYLRRYLGAARSGLHGLNFLQEIRLGVSGGVTEDCYKNLIPRPVESLVAALGSVSPHYIVSPPSKYPFAREYAHDLASHFGCVNLSDRLAFSNNHIRATGGATAEQLLNSWAISDLPDFRDGEIILLVDDVISKGSTMAALVATILRCSSERQLRFIGIAPLWVTSPRQR